MSLPTTSEILDRLHPGIAAWVKVESGWSGLSDIQRAAIPAILEGLDCVIEAPTAGGKTEAVLFPTLSRAAATKSSRDSGSVKILYLAPLRALLNNLEQRGEKHAERCGLRAFKWHGDVGQREKVETLRDPPDLLMTTPESTEAILLRKRADWQRLLGDLQCVIIDEAHNFAAGDRGGHLLSLLQRLEDGATKPPQRIALSATLGNPEAMVDWLAGPQRTRGRRIAVSSNKPVKKDFLIQHFEETEASPETSPETNAEYRRFSVLTDLLSAKAGSAKSLVFVGSRRKAEAFAKAFQVNNRHTRTGRQLRIRTHHSAVSRFFREEAESLIQDTSEDGLHAILSTSTLELGIDIGELSQVIQMDSLASPSSFLQRVGRTGRREGKPQFFRGLTATLDQLLLQTATVSLGLQGISEALLLPRRAFHLLAHQLICLSLQDFGVSPSRAWQLFSSVHCFSEMTAEEFDRLVEHMVKTDYLRLVDGSLVVGDATDKKFLHSNWRRLFAVFDSAPLYEVLHGRQSVGTLDASFVEGLDPPIAFVLGGKLWKSNRISPKSHQVHATPAKEGGAPSWVNFGGPEIPFETAQEVGRLLHEQQVPAFLHPATKTTLAGLQQAYSEKAWEPRTVRWRVGASGTGYIHTYAGDRINRTLARLLNLSPGVKATASYFEVKVISEPTDPVLVTSLIRDTLTELRSGSWSEAGPLADTLTKNQGLFPFSPFARCLPKDLWASTLVEQTLDPKGLLKLVR